MNEIVTSLLGDCLAAKGVAFSGGISTTVGVAIRSLIHKRHEMLREVVLSEIRQGNFNGVDQDELISVYFRLIRDAEEGVAKINLRLMARMVNGMAEKNELKASSFLKFSSILSSLTEDEIQVLSIMIKDALQSYKGKKDSDLSFWPNPGEKELAKSYTNYVSIQQSLVRTGLIEMEIDTSLHEDRVSRTLGGPRDIVRATHTTTEITFRLTRLADEIAGYIKSFNIEGK